jgi:hypothetical protein
VLELPTFVVGKLISVVLKLIVLAVGSSHAKVKSSMAELALAPEPEEPVTATTRIVTMPDWLSKAFPKLTCIGLLEKVLPPVVKVPVVEGTIKLEGLAPNP